MEKNTKIMHSGFTIAELLLSLLVVMVVATALVPIIGPKKVKFPAINRNTGVFECYYDDNGTLMQYHADKKRNKDAVPTASPYGDHCEFDVPLASHHEIYAIGAGTSGADLDESKVGYDITGVFSLRGNLDVDNWVDSINEADNYSNQATGINGSLSDAVRDAINEWATQLRNSGSDLYVAFSDMRCPVGRGGNGWSEAVHSLNPSKNHKICSKCSNKNYANYCHDYSYRNSAFNENFRGKGEDYVRYTYPKSQVQLAVNNDDKCVWLTHAAGGDSAAGRKMDSGMLLVPVDGDKSGGIVTMFNDERAFIETTTSRGNAQIDLKAKYGGDDASRSPIGDGANGTDGTPVDYFRNDDRIVKYKVGNSYSTPTRIEDVFSTTYRNHGATHGDTYEGGSYPGESATTGEANYSRYPFQWEYSKLQAKYYYIKAGLPGGVRVISYNNLKGKRLFMYPGRTTGAGGAGGVTPTIVATENSPNDTTKRVLSAQSSVNHQGFNPYGTFTEDLNPENMPFPHPDIVTEATPNNEQFGRYIDRIRSIGLKNGLYSCVDNGKCPGYAGGGAFPYMDSITGSNTLTIRDLQSLCTNSPGSHAKPYTLTLPANSSLTCPEGTVLKTKANRRSYIDASGHTVEYEEKYCASTAQAGNGAVVIIW